jgi:hypothetical protein
LIITNMCDNHEFRSAYLGRLKEEKHRSGRKPMWWNTNVLHSFRKGGVRTMSSQQKSYERFFDYNTLIGTEHRTLVNNWMEVSGQYIGMNEARQCRRQAWRSKAFFWVSFVPAFLSLYWSAPAVVPEDSDGTSITIFSIMLFFLALIVLNGVFGIVNSAADRHEGSSSISMPFRTRPGAQ